MVGPFVIVEAKVALERGLELPEPGEVAAPELHPPMVVQDRVLEALDEAVGQGVPGLRAGMADDPAGPAGLREAAPELSDGSQG